MKQMKWFKRALSSIMTVLMLISAVGMPISAFAAESLQENDLTVDVAALPLLEEVADQLDEGERVSAEAYEMQQRPLMVRVSPPSLPAPIRVSITQSLIVVIRPTSSVARSPLWNPLPQRQRISLETLLRYWQNLSRTRTKMKILSAPVLGTPFLTRT